MLVLHVAVGTSATMPQWVETVCRRRVHFMVKDLFPTSSVSVSGRASERISAMERASKASSAEQANECVVRANEQTEEPMAQYSMRLFLNH